MPDLGQFLIFKTENRDAVASLYLSSGDLRCTFRFEASFYLQLVPTRSSLEIIRPYLAQIVLDIGQFSTSKTEIRDAVSYLYL